MTNITTVDCRGLACPQPVIRTKAALEGATTGLVVIVDNQGSATNVQRFARGQGAQVTVTERGDDIYLGIERSEGRAVVSEPAIACSSEDPGGSVVYVAGETMGHGDEELGAILMEAFLDTLAQFKGEVTHAIFVNAGARLAVEGSPVLDQIRQLEEVGVEVLVCGTCLNHFGLSDELAVGKVSNMYAIIETLKSAGRVIRP